MLDNHREQQGEHEAPVTYVLTYQNQGNIGTSAELLEEFHRLFYVELYRWCEERHGGY